MLIESRKRDKTLQNWIKEYYYFSNTEESVKQIPVIDDCCYDFIFFKEAQIFTLKLEGGMLNVYQKGKNQGVLYPESEFVFFAEKTSEESFEFKKNDSGTYDAYMDFQGVRWKGIRIKN